MLGAFRIRLNVPTQHPEQRPDTLPLAVQERRDSSEHTIFDIPADDHPSGAPFPIYPVPGILESREPRETHNITVKVIIPGIMRLNKMMKQFPGKGVRISELNPVLFARMLAKIAHGICFGEFRGMPTGFKPLLLDVILAKSGDFTQVVGCLPEIPEPQPGVPHTVSLNRIEYDGKSFLCADLRIFAFLATPVYRLVYAVGPLQEGIPSLEK
jgi:hypothetical protein